MSDYSKGYVERLHVLMVILILIATERNDGKILYPKCAEITDNDSIIKVCDYVCSKMAPFYRQEL